MHTVLRNVQWISIDTEFYYNPAVLTSKAQQSASTITPTMSSFCCPPEATPQEWAPGDPPTASLVSRKYGRGTLLTSINKQSWNGKQPWVRAWQSSITWYIIRVLRNYGSSKNLNVKWCGRPDFIVSMGFQQCRWVSTSLGLKLSRPTLRKPSPSLSEESGDVSSWAAPPSTKKICHNLDIVEFAGGLKIEL